MRIATNQFYQMNTTKLMQLQSDTNNTLSHLASGKKIHTAADDPVGAIMLENLQQQRNQLSQYQSNIDLANNRLSQQEGRVAEFETLIMNAREFMIQGNNGSYSDENKLAIAQDLEETRTAMISLANNQDESGNYLFSGFQTNTKPFVLDDDGKVGYNGDSGVKEAVIADGVSIPVSVPGDRLFMSSANPVGDYRADYGSATMQGEYFIDSAKITDPGSHALGDATIKFEDDGAGAVMVRVLDSNGDELLAAQPFDASKPLEFNGMQVSLSGEPAIGDEVTLSHQPEIDVFSNLKSAIDMLSGESGLSGNNQDAAYGQVLNDIGEILNNATVVRAESGNALKALDTFDAQHQNLEVVVATAQSTIEDLDYSSAIIQYEQQSLAMTALSQTFGQVNNLSLFNYI